MADIKIKEKSNIKIKKLDKAKIYSERVKDNIVNLKSKDDYTDNTENNSPTEYGANQISQTTERISRTGIEKFNQYGKKSAIETKDNIKETAEKIKTKLQDPKTKEIIVDTNTMITEEILKREVIIINEDDFDT